MTATAHLVPHGVHATARVSPVVMVRDQVVFATVAMWRSRTVLVFTFVLPLVWLVVIGLVAGNAAVDATSGVRVMQFATPMAAVLGLLLSAYPPVAFGLALAREQKILKRLGGTPVPIWAHLLGRVGAAVVLSAAAVLVMLGVGVAAYGVQLRPETAAASIVTLVLGIACLAALGLAVGAVAPSGSTAQTFAIASALVVAFLSGLMTFGLEPPAWMDLVGSLFPVHHLLEPLRNQFNPFRDGPGWDLTALAVLAAWGAGSILVAVWALRRDPRNRSLESSRPGSRTDGRLRVGETARLSAGSMVLDQLRWGTMAARRDFGWVFFAIAMPVGLYALMAMQLTDVDISPRGIPFNVYFAAGMAAYGTSITAFINMPEAVDIGRDRGVLKRLRGTPLAPWQYLAGRTASVLWIALLTAALIFGVGAVLFRVELSVGAIPLGIAVLLFGTLTLAACGYALAALAPSGRAAGLLGLGIILPLAFISDVFPFGGTMPELLTTIASAFPLVHLVHALADAVAPTGRTLQAVDLVVMGAWLIGATMVAVRWFRWEPRH